MAKYNKQLVKRITNLIRSDFYTIPELCLLSGISESTYHNWKANKLEFSEEIQKARMIRDEKTIVAARRSLFKLIEGYYYENYKTIYENSGKVDPEGKPIRKAKEWTIYKKYYPPQLAAIIFALTNLDGEHWKNTFRVEVTGKNGSGITPDSPWVITISGVRKALNEMTDGEIDKKIAESALKKIDNCSVSAARIQ
jgi:hypothetical protein